MFLSTAGVGIGGSPASGKELDVTGNVQVTGDLIVDNITIDGSTITNASGNLTIVNTADDGDVIFKSDDGSGGVAEYMRLDGGITSIVTSKDILMGVDGDGGKLKLGAGQDLQIFHDGTDSKIQSSGVGDLIIEQRNDDKDIVFNSDNGSGGINEYLRIDGSEVLINVSATNGMQFDDNVRIKIGSGTGGDLRIYHDGSNSYIEDSGTGDLIISGDNDVMIKDGTGNLLFNGNASNSVELYFGGSKKFETTSTGVKVQSTGTATLTLLDADDSSEVSINHNAGVTTILYSDLIFDAGGGNNVLQLTSAINALENITLPDSKKILLGTGADLEIYHDGSNSYIDEVGTGSLFIRGSDIFIKANATEDAIIARANAEVELYHNGSEKFATTSTGATVTGDLGITGALSKGSGSFKIDHPVKPDTHYLYHSFVESPLTDLIYRGKTKLTNGKGSINIDRHFGMTEGTFVALIDDKQVFTTNEDSWDAVRGKIQGNELHIECQNKDFDGYVSWLVIGDRKDKHIIEVDWTDDKGKPILEIEK
jgi:hypothetical protein